MPRQHRAGLRARYLGAGFGLLLVVLSPLRERLTAQSRAGAGIVIQGSVFDSTGTPVEGAEVLILGADRVVTTTARGEFTLGALAREPAVVRVRRMGYRARSVIVEPAIDSDTLTLSVELEVLTVTLDPVLVKAMEEKYTAKMAGFADRMKHAPRSSFLTRADIEKRAPLRTSDLMAQLATVRCQRGELYLDGIHVRGYNLDWIQPSEIEAIEFYRGAAQIPMRFNATLPGGRSPGCVTVIWTR